MGWSRRAASGRSCSLGVSSTGVFKLEKQGSRESQAHMLRLTVRQEVDWCDDFMAQFSSAGDLNSEIVSGQRRIKWIFVFIYFIFLLFSQLCGHRVTIVAATQAILINYLLDTIWGLQLSPACPDGVEERNLASY